MPRLRLPGEPRVKGAARSTVEAIMVTFCARGVEALADQDCRLRLATLSAAQIEEVIDRLRRLNLDEDLIKKLEGQL